MENLKDRAAAVGLKIVAVGDGYVVVDIKKHSLVASTRGEIMFTLKQVSKIVSGFEIWTPLNA